MQSMLGEVVHLPILSLDHRGAIFEVVLEDDQLERLQLPAAELPADAQVGQKIRLYVYLNSLDAPVVTTTMPKVMPGEVAFLEVVDSAPFGHFVDWGLPKNLLVPFREQLEPMRVGERYAVAVYIDDTGRLAGTTRVSELIQAGGDYALGQWVDGVAWREEPGLGLFVILEGQYLALLPSSEPHRLSRGQATRFRVAYIHPDGKVEVSLRGLAHEEIERDAEKILQAISAPRPPLVGDHSDPEELTRLFGISKKAFKRAVGRLLKQGRVVIDHNHFVRVAPPGTLPRISRRRYYNEPDPVLSREDDYDDEAEWDDRHSDSRRPWGGDAGQRGGRNNSSSSSAPNARYGERQGGRAGESSGSPRPEDRPLRYHDHYAPQRPSDREGASSGGSRGASPRAGSSRTRPAEAPRERFQEYIPEPSRRKKG